MAARGGHDGWGRVSDAMVARTRCGMGRLAAFHRHGHAGGHPRRGSVGVARVVFRSARCLCGEARGWPPEAAMTGGGGSVTQWSSGLVAPWGLSPPLRHGHAGGHPRRGTVGAARVVVCAPRRLCCEARGWPPEAAMTGGGWISDARSVRTRCGMGRLAAFHRHGHAGGHPRRGSVGVARAVFRSARCLCGQARGWPPEAAMTGKGRRAGENLSPRAGARLTLPRIRSIEGARF